jgi:ribosomal protein S12 methylthiotransferase accessory factor
MRIDVSFPGGLAVDATIPGFTIRTDQPVGAGGGGTAPSPFDLFLASIGACAGFYALRFCQGRGISTEGLAVSLEDRRDGGHGMVTEVRLEVSLPDGFPEKYRDALLRAVDQCSVKRHLLQPPRFEVTAHESAAVCVG